jgi:5-methylcytosine-specific restriction endonuclease McrA
MTNAYDSTRGNVTDRQRRKVWLLETYAADCAIAVPTRFKVELIIPASQIERYRADGDTVYHCCRCYRCGKLLTLETVTVDRIIPGCKGGTYRRNNIRPSCSDCANKQGGELRAEIRSSVPVVRSRVPELATRNTPAGGDGARAVSVPDVPASGEGNLRRNGPLEGGA